MSTHFYGSDFFSGDFFGSAPTPVVVIDTHDGERKRKRDEEQRQAQERRREQLEVAFGLRPPAAQSKEKLALAVPRPDIAPIASVPSFDFDADDEEIILLL